MLVRSAALVVLGAFTIACAEPEIGAPPRETAVRHVSSWAGRHDFVSCSSITVIDDYSVHAEELFYVVEASFASSSRAPTGASCWV